MKQRMFRVFGPLVPGIGASAVVLFFTAVSAATAEVSAATKRYVPVEYLEGRGAQWVDTEMHFAYGQSFSFRWSVSPDYAAYGDFGFIGSWSVSGDGLAICGAGPKQAINYPLAVEMLGGRRLFSPEWNRSTFTIADVYEDVCTLGERITYTMQRLRDRDIRCLSPCDNPKERDFVSSDTIYILRSKDTRNYMSNKRVYGATLTDTATGEMLMNLVPVVVEEDVGDGTVGTPAFYDTIRDKVLTNMTKTALLAGPEKTDDIRWNAQTGKFEFLMTVSAVGDGEFSVNGGEAVTGWSQWVPNGTAVALAAHPAEGSALRFWSGDTGSADRSAAGVSITADRARSLAANFAPVAEVSRCWILEPSNTVVHAGSGVRLKVSSIGGGAMSVTGVVDLDGQTEIDLSPPVYSSDGSFVHPLEIIGKDAFKNNLTIEHVIMPDTVTNIGANAFYGCKALKFVRISTNLVSIGSGAFQSGSDANRRFFYPEMLPHSVVSIGSSAFNDAYVSNAVLTVDNPGLKSWGSMAFLANRFRVMDFSKCGTDKNADGFTDANGLLETIIFPKVLQEITYGGTYFLGGCGALKAICVPGDPFEMTAKSFMGNIGSRSLCWYLPKWNKKWESYLSDTNRCAVSEVTTAFCRDYAAAHTAEELPVQMLAMGTKSPTVRQKAFGLRWWYPDAPPVYEPVDYFDVLSWEGRKATASEGAEALFDGTTWAADTTLNRFLWTNTLSAVTCEFDETCTNTRALKLTGYRLYQSCFQTNTEKYPNGRAPTAWRLEGRLLRNGEWVTLDEQTMTASSPKRWAYFGYETYSETVPARTDCVLEYSIDAAKRDAYTAFRFTPLASRNTETGVADDYPVALMEISFVGMVTTPEPAVGGFALEEAAWNSLDFTATVTGFGDDAVGGLHSASAVAWVEVSEDGGFTETTAVSPCREVTLNAAGVFTVPGLAGDSAYHARLVVSNDLGGVTVKTLEEPVSTLSSPYILGDAVASTDGQGRLTVDFSLERLYAPSATVRVYVADAPGAGFMLAKELTVTASGKVDFGEIYYMPPATAVVRVEVSAGGKSESTETSAFGVWLVDAGAGTITEMKTKASFSVTVSGETGLTLSARGETGDVTAFDFTVPFVDASGRTYGLVSPGTVFKGDSKTVEILLPDTITEICNEAFMNMPLLVKMRLPAQLEKIGKDAFSGCVQLEDVEPLFPVSCTNFGDRAFSGCSKLPDFVLSDEITHLPYYLFHSCKSINNVRLPAKLKTMGTGVFWYCYGLTNVVPYLPDSISGVISDYIFANAPIRAERLYLNNPGITAFAAGPFNGNLFKYVDLSKTRITSVGAPWTGNGALRGIVFPETFKSFTAQTFHSMNGTGQAVEVRFMGDVPTVTYTASQKLFYNTSINTKFLFRARYTNRSWHDYIDGYLDREIDVGDGETAVFVRRPTGAEIAAFKTEFPDMKTPQYMIRLQPYTMFDRMVYFRWLPQEGMRIIVR